MSARKSPEMAFALVEVLAGRMTAHAAAIRFSVSRSALYRAVDKALGRTRAAPKAEKIDENDPRLVRALRDVLDGSSVFDAARRESLPPPLVYQHALEMELIKPDPV